MKKQTETNPDMYEKHCVVFVIRRGNGTKLFDYLEADPKLTPIYHWVQGEWNNQTTEEENNENTDTERS